MREPTLYMIVTGRRVFGVVGALVPLASGGHNSSCMLLALVSEEYAWD